MAGPYFGSFAARGRQPTSFGPRDTLRLRCLFVPLYLLRVTLQTSLTSDLSFIPAAASQIQGRTDRTCEKRGAAALAGAAPSGARNFTFTLASFTNIIYALQSQSAGRSHKTTSYYFAITKAVARATILVITFCPCAHLLSSTTFLQQVCTPPGAPPPFPCASAPDPEETRGVC